MARVKISEFTAKTILAKELKLHWKGFSATSRTKTTEITRYFGKKKLVVKVDQGVKKRGKKGLVGVGKMPRECVAFIAEKSKLGYSQFLIEEFIEHTSDEEHYLSLERVRDGKKILYSEKGGVDIEDNWNSIKEFREKSVDKKTQHGEFILQLCQIMDHYHFSFLEINPLVIRESAGSRRNKFVLLDCAALVDDAGFNPYRSAGEIFELSESPAEKRVRELDATTPASLKLKIINPNGNIWMLLSGGGASLVLADEVADLGYGKALGNYGEYSGSPSTEDTYLYTQVILQSLLSSKDANKVFIIAGGVANFTDVAKTFKGIIQALGEVKSKLKDQRIKVFVRRGGPNQKAGLEIMEKFLKEHDLLGLVAGPEMVLTEIVIKAIRNSKFEI